MRCTWVDCPNEAEHPQTATDGQVWANLCDQHNTEIDSGIDKAVEGDVKGMLSSWVKAQGGHKKAANRMVGGD